MVLIVLLANKDASSLWRANPSCKTARNCVEIHNMNLQRNWGGRALAVKAEQKCIHIFGNEGRSEMWNYSSFAVNAEGKCGGGTSHILQLPMFGNEGRVLVEKPIFRSLAVKTKRKCRSETANLWKSRQRWNAEAELHIFGSPGRTSEESGTSDLCQSSAGAELHICGSKGRAEVRKRNFTFLAVNSERKCGRGTSDLWQSKQSGNAEAEHHVFGSQGRAEVWKRNFRSLAVKTERKCSPALWQTSQVGRAEADLNSFDRPISYWLSLPMLKNNSTDCYIEGQCEDHVWLKHMTFAMRVTRSICSCKGSG